MERGRRIIWAGDEQDWGQFKQLIISIEKQRKKANKIQENLIIKFSQF